MITVYVFWNLHEPVRGTYDFMTGRKNLPMFLQKAAHHGLFVYLRPGPYVCARSSGTTAGCRCGFTDSRGCGLGPRRPLGKPRRHGGFRR